MKTFEELEKEIKVKIEEKQNELSDQIMDSMLKNLHERFETWTQFSASESSLLESIFEGMFHIENIESRIEHFFRMQIEFPSMFEMKKANIKNQKQILNTFFDHIDTMTISKEIYKEYFGCNMYTKKNRLQHIYKNDGIVITEKEEEEMNEIVRNCWKEILIFFFSTEEKNMFPVYQRLFQWKNHPLYHHEKKEMPEVPFEHEIDKSMKPKEARIIKQKYRTFAHSISNEQTMKTYLEGIENLQYISSMLYVLKNASETKEIIIKKAKENISKKTEEIQKEIKYAKKGNIDHTIRYIEGSLMESLKSDYKVLGKLTKKEGR